jgi:tRNA(Ile)-lysidine synthase
MPLATRFRSFVAQNELLDKDDRILVAISGGIDSTTLLHLLVAEGYTVAIAHCNFGLRADESDGDERHVRALQQRHQLDGFYVRFDTEREAQKAGESIQMAARRLRYEWFMRLCNTEGYQYIAIAHNADDVAETFFLNLTRGTGLKGLTGIKPKTGRVVRPLLFATRHEIEEYARQHGIEFREDSTNAKDKYARNRIRHNVVPQLKLINPSFAQTMLDNIARLQQVEDLVTQAVNRFRADAVTATPHQIRISIRQLRCNRNASLLLYEFLCEYGFNSSQTEGIIHSIESGESGRQFVSPSHLLLRDRDHLILTPTPKGKADDIYQIETDCSSISSPITLKFDAISTSKSFQIDKRSTAACLDLAKLRFPLTLRRWQSGDEFVPLGMKGTKKLSDFFIDQKLSIIDKENQWLLCSGTDIVWVVGHRIDDRYKLTPQTSTAYIVSLSV